MRRRAASPPTPLFCHTDSLAERIQAAFPGARVVRSLNTVNAEVMVDPDRLAGDSTAFVADEDPDARDWARTELLERWFGWRHVVDRGGVTAARGPEMWLPLWQRAMDAAGTAIFDLKIVTEP
jgi:hypothetical protein